MRKKIPHFLWRVRIFYIALTLWSKVLRRGNTNINQKFFVYFLHFSQLNRTFATELQTLTEMEKLINLSINDRIARITMQDAEHFNCLSEGMCAELIEAIDEAYAAECVGIIIDAECKRGVWSAGHNIHELPTDGSDPLAYEVPMEQLLRKFLFR